MSRTRCNTPPRWSFRPSERQRARAGIHNHHPCLHGHTGSMGSGSSPHSGEEPLCGSPGTTAARFHLFTCKTATLRRSGRSVTLGGCRLRVIFTPPVTRGQSAERRTVLAIAPLRALRSARSETLARRLASPCDRRCNAPRRSCRGFLRARACLLRPRRAGIGRRTVAAPGGLQVPTRGTAPRLRPTVCLRKAPCGEPG